MTTPVKNISKAEAASLTKKIREAVDSAWSLLLEAHDRKAWTALGYETWERYVKTEFGISRGRSYQLIDQGRVINAVKEVTGDLSTKVDIDERQAREIKRDLPKVTAEIKERVERGEPPQQAAKEVIAAAVEKAKPASKPVPEPKRQPSPPTAPELDGQDRIAELEECVTALEAENAALKAENKFYGEMKVQWEQGGFAKVIDGLKEQIKVLNTRVATESQEKVKNLRSMDYWKKQAIKLGFSRNAVIDIETGEEVNG